MITYEGTEYPFDTSFEQVTISEWREVKRKLKLTIRGVIEGVEQLDPDAITALYWLTVRSDGRHDDLVLGDSLEFNPIVFMAAWAEAGAEAAAEGEGEADPTAGGSLPDGETPATTPTARVTSATSGTASTKGTSNGSGASTSSSSPVTAGSSPVTSDA
jgi:hypothetical protein